MKITFLTPCLLTDNSRAAVYKCFDFIKEIAPGIHSYVFAQEFTPADYEKFKSYNVTLIGNCERKGFNFPRNELLKTFYESDYDYAIWRDAPDNISKPSINDFLTMVKNLEDGVIDVDLISASLGIKISSDRMDLKKSSDNQTHSTLLAVKNNRTLANDSALHFTTIANFKKKYSKELYINDDCDPNTGIPEDHYLVTKIWLAFKKIYSAPCIVSSKQGGAAASTWRAGTASGNFDYPPMRWQALTNLAIEDLEKQGVETTGWEKENIKMPRVLEYCEFVTDYKPRKKKVKESSEESLF